MDLKHVIAFHCLLLGIMEVAGDSEVIIELPSEGYCREQHSGTCTATFSSRVLVDISGFGSHLFTRNSDDGVVDVGGVSLSLTDVTRNRPRHDFVVSIVYSVEQSLTITCTNYEVTDVHEVVLMSGPCLSPIQYIPSTGTLVWDPPMCSGWQNDTVYIIRVEINDKHFERSTDRNSYVLPVGIKGLTAVTLQAYNSCGEKTELNRTLIDVGISTGGLGGDGSDSGGTLGLSKLESSLITFFSIGIGTPILLLVLIYIIAVFYKVKTNAHEEI